MAPPLKRSVRGPHDVAAEADLKVVSWENQEAQLKISGT